MCRRALLTPRASLLLHGLDSLKAMELVARLEDRFGQRLPESLLCEYPDVESLAALLSGGALRGPGGAGRREMIADAELDAGIVPAQGSVGPAEPRQVLLTGATGFLGAYLLRTLLAETHADVHCLVRAEVGRGLDRIRQNLARYRLWNPEWTSRIYVVKGDLREAQLGIDAPDFDALAAAVDTIVHAGAAVNWVLPYAALKDTNVTATRELLRLACATRPKTFHFVSSLSVCYAAGGPPVVGERDDMLPQVDHLPLGYAQTKCVSESLVRAAASRGLAARIHRPALLVGDSVSGRSNVDDIVAALIRGSVQMGTAPDLDWCLDAVPVDYAARAMLGLVSSDVALTTLHLQSPRPRHWRECVLWLNVFGYRCRLVPFREWRSQLDREATTPAHPLFALRPFFAERAGGESSAAELYQVHQRSRVALTGHARHRTGPRLAAARSRHRPSRSHGAQLH